MEQRCWGWGRDDGQEEGIARMQHGNLEMIYISSILILVMGTCLYQNLQNFTLKMCAVFYMEIVLQIKKKKIENFTLNTCWQKRVLRIVLWGISWIFPKIILGMLFNFLLFSFFSWILFSFLVCSLMLWKTFFRGTVRKDTSVKLPEQYL